MPEGVLLFVCLTIVLVEESKNFTFTLTYVDIFSLHISSMQINIYE